MSNKNLGLAIVGVIVIAAAVFGILRSRNNSQVASTESTTKSEDQQTQPSTNQDSMTDNSSCVRNFNADTLKTAKVATANQFVTLQVKDFGTIKIQLYDKDAPKAVENFLRLTNAGYYDCLTFHRIAADFVIQGGDPTGSGAGGDSAFGGEFADELNANTTSFKAGYQKGVVAMANRGPNTNTSQFFIMLDSKPLPPLYTIFGKVVAGQDVVDKIGQLQTSPPGDGAPVQKVIIEKATISSN
jgi:cyclophilin family peptidyl-prolyl cis-trans isomerase